MAPLRNQTAEVIRMSWGWIILSVPLSCCETSGQSVPTTFWFLVNSIGGSRFPALLTGCRAVLNSTRSVSFFPPEAFPITPPFSYPFSFMPVPWHRGFGYFRDLLLLFAVSRVYWSCCLDKMRNYFFRPGNTYFYTCLNIIVKSEACKATWLKLLTSVVQLVSVSWRTGRSSVLLNPSVRNTVTVWLAGATVYTLNVPATLVH